MSDKTIRLSVDVSPELNKKLEELAEKTHSSKSDVLRRAVVLFDVMTTAQENGEKKDIFLV